MGIIFAHCTPYNEKMMHKGGLAYNRALPALCACKAVRHCMTRPIQAGQHPLKRRCLSDLRSLGHVIDATEGDARSSTSRNATCRATAGALAAGRIRSINHFGVLAVLACSTQCSIVI